MESVVYEDSPLAAYLEDEGGEDLRGIPSTDDHEDSATTSSPSFAPRGQPKVWLKPRNHIPPPLRLSVPQSQAVATIHKTYSRAINSRLGRADNTRFLERFRYTIVASQLLNIHSYLGQTVHVRPRDANPPVLTVQRRGATTLVGASVTVLCVFTLVWLISWAMGGSNSMTGKCRVLISLLVLAGVGICSQAYMRRQWLQYLRAQVLSETTELVAIAHEFDQVAAGAMTLVQEVELVSRGYRLSTPLPPISRLEDRSQTRRCTRLRKAFRLCFAEVIPLYNNACDVLKPLAEQLDLEKYFDIYDINDLDYSEAMQGYSESEFEDIDSVRVLKILAARFHTTRKVFLCCLMALNATGEKTDFLRWNAALDEIKAITTATGSAEKQLRSILEEEENFPVPPTPKLPLSPNRERWRAQLRKLGSLSTGIRGLQAKLHILREESDNNLDESADVSELGTNLMIQYEAIGMDLRSLMQEWENGKAALTLNIDRNEKRVSSMSGMLSPTISLGGLTAVDEGNVSDALRALNGESRSRSSMDFSSSDAEEVFEAVALPRQRPLSTMTREERIKKMKKDRIKKESMRDSRDANTHMLRELESVINMRPRGRTTAHGRITSI